MKGAAWEIIGKVWSLHQIIELIIAIIKWESSNEETWTYTAFYWWVFNHIFLSLLLCAALLGSSPKRRGQWRRLINQTWTWHFGDLGGGRREILMARQEWRRSWRNNAEEYAPGSCDVPIQFYFYASRVLFFSAFTDCLQQQRRERRSWKPTELHKQHLICSSDHRLDRLTGLWPETICFYF